ncbi:DUF2270 domain-containing protein [Salinirubellus salinus]|uniref:DUF2270 domain-containing protein n=1 Tax=Salinirubellus salinus TaxID=1364945 RepID=A0A9E7R6R1_9EURY|nr:DUF2270 domain-containing protein [Salinirubellus salinus]UWM56214.1 DUF2270 domain-containing protein [Salinirubellus salinus]
MTDASTGPPHETEPDEASSDAESPPVDSAPTAAPDESGDANVGYGLLDEEMGPSGAMAHLYRGEVHRMKLWRERLDQTTNWAVLLLAAILTWAFSNPSNPHYVLLIGNIAVGLFLVIEARRYRAYDMWRSRVRTLQRNVFAPGLDPTREVDPDWREHLAADYYQPTLKITFEEALAHRLRRVYLPLFCILDGAWVLRVTAFSAVPWPESAAIGVVSGLAVTAGLAVAFCAALFVALRPRTWRAQDELRTEDIRSPHE